MGVLFLTWLGFAVVTGDKRPQVLDLLLGSIGGIWFGVVVKLQGQQDERTERTAIRAEAKADEALDKASDGAANG